MCDGASCQEQRSTRGPEFGAHVAQDLTARADGLSLGRVNVRKLCPIEVRGQVAVINVEEIAGHGVLLVRGGSTSDLSVGNASTVAADPMIWYMVFLSSGCEHFE